MQSGTPAEPLAPGILAAAFDESGKLHDSEIVSFGGVVLSPAATNAFSEQWVQIVRDANASEFSMKDAMNFHGPFSGWRDRVKDRDELLLALAMLTAETERFAAPMSTEDFKALQKTQRNKLGGNLQYCGFEAAVKGVLRAYPAYAVHVICDLSEEYAARCVNLYNKLRAQNENVKERCFAITFADDRGNPHLQAADLVAYCCRADHMRQSRPIKPIVEQMISILDMNGSTLDYFVYRTGGGGLGAGEFELPIQD